MWRPATAAWPKASTVRAQRAKSSKDEVMSVGRQRVTPVSRRASRARAAASAVVAGSLKSTPAKPLTCRSKKPGARTRTALPSDLADAPQLADQGHGRRLRGQVGRRARDEDRRPGPRRSEEHTSELQSHVNLVCRLLLEKKKKHNYTPTPTNKKNIPIKTI